MTDLVSLVRSVVCSCWLCPFFASPPSAYRGRGSRARSSRRAAGPHDEYEGEELDDLEQQRADHDAVYEKDISSDEDDEDEDEEEDNGAVEGGRRGEDETQLEEGAVEGETGLPRRAAQTDDLQPGQPKQDKAHTTPKHDKGKNRTSKNSKQQPARLSQPPAAPLPVATPIRHSASSSSLASPFSSLAAFLSSPSPSAASPPTTTSSSSSSTPVPPAVSSLKLPPPPSDSSTHYWLSRAADERRRRDAHNDRNNAEFVYTEKELDIDAFYEKEVVGSRRTAPASAGSAGADGQHDSESGGGGEAGEAGEDAERRERRKRGLLDEIDVEPDLNAIMDELDGI